MSDLISRQTAINEISRWLGYLDDDMILRIQMGLRKLPSVQHVATDINVGDKISRKGVFIPNITVEMFRNASLEGVEDLMASGEMEDISLPSSQPEQKWIPVSERLPEEGGSYLVSGRWSSGKISVGDCEYSTSDGYFHTAWNFDVHAWMPLPKPYMEGDTK